MEKDIHVKFNDTKSNTKISKMDESITDLRLDDCIGPSTTFTTTNQSIEVDASNQNIGPPSVS